MQELKNEWTKRYTRETDEGDKDYYSCRNNPKCSKTVFVLRHAESLETSIWISNNQHNHTDVEQKGRLPSDTVQFIENLMTFNFR